MNELVLFLRKINCMQRKLKIYFQVQLKYFIRILHYQFKNVILAIKERKSYRLHSVRNNKYTVLFLHLSNSAVTFKIHSIQLTQCGPTTLSEC